MTILNLPSDGLYPILLTLARTVAKAKSISPSELIDTCVPQAAFVKEGGGTLSARARATLMRWTALGLFVEDGDEIRLSLDMIRGESTDQFSDRISCVCRRLALSHDHARPLWSESGGVSEEETGRTADLCRALAWCLAQDIYSLPSGYKDIEALAISQIKPGRFIFLNDTRWSGFRSWARFLGFANGEEGRFFLDPTAAVRAELREIMKVKQSLPAGEFVIKLAERLPVMDSGAYRQEIESEFRTETWKGPGPGEISTALSFALKRLQRQGTVRLDSLADAGSRMTLVGQGGRAWDSFTHVSLLKEGS